MKQFRQIGIDLARFGSDESVIYMRQGAAILHWERLVKTEPGDVIEKAFLMQSDALWTDDETLYVVDAGGMGQGVMRDFYLAKKKLMEFHNGGKSSDPRFRNKISEGWFHLRELIRERRCWIPDDPVLLYQLETRKYHLDKATGKILVESKDDYKKRLKIESSPDRADALVYAFYEGGPARGKVKRLTQSGPTPSVRRW